MGTVCKYTAHTVKLILQLLTGLHSRLPPYWYSTHTIRLIQQSYHITDGLGTRKPYTSYLTKFWTSHEIWLKCGGGGGGGGGLYQGPRAGSEFVV